MASCLQPRVHKCSEISEDRLAGRQRGWTASSLKAPPTPAINNHHNALRFGQAQIAGNRYSEDRFAFDEIFVEGDVVPVLSVFDGHGGWQVATFLEQNLISKFQQHLHVSACKTPSLLAEALRLSYLELDAQLEDKVRKTLQLGFDRFNRVGSCAITVAVSPTDIIVANSGDCRAVLACKNGAVQVSRVHNVADSEERRKVRNQHMNENEFDVVQCQTVFEDLATKTIHFDAQAGRTPKEINCYIKGRLQPSRAFGDFALKRQDMNIDLTTGKPIIASANSMPYITAEPEVMTFHRNDDQEFLVLGSDGLFDYLDPSDVVKISRDAGTPENAAAALIQESKTRALARHSLSEESYRELTPRERRKVHDDITVLVYFLQYPQTWIKTWQKLSTRLQGICDLAVAEHMCEDVRLADFCCSVCLADPLLKDCPLVAVSEGFEELTGYNCLDAIGRNCRFLSYGVPKHLRDEETSERLRAYTLLAMSDDPFSIAEQHVSPPSWAPDQGVHSAAYFRRWNRRSDGELFQNLFVLRQIWLGRRPLILALQTRFEGDAADWLAPRLDLLCKDLSKSIMDYSADLETYLSPSLAASADATDLLSQKKRRADKLARLLSCDSRRAISDDYRLGRTLGEGHHGHVLHGVHKKTGKEVAIKVIVLPFGDTTSSTERAAIREVTTLRQFYHNRNVVQFIDCYVDLVAVYVVMELCEGSLLEWLLSLQTRDLRPSEELVANLLGQMLCAVQSCHRHDTLLLDVKLDNFVFEMGTNPASPHIKLIDFDLAEPMEELSTRVVGTAPYIAPEVITGLKSKSSDVWSLGVALYILLTGGYSPQFTSEGELSGDTLTFLQHCSSDAVDLCLNMLQKDPTARLTTGNVAAHPFMRGKCGQS